MSSISFFHTGFVICLAGTILFLVITIVLFFAFDIRTIFSIRSGRAQAKTVKEMELANSSTGRLRATKKSRVSAQPDKKQRTSPNRPPVIQPPVNESAPSQVDDSISDDSQSVTEKLSPDAQTANEKPEENTVLLSRVDETPVQNQSSETDVLTSADSQNTRQSTGPVYFEIVKKIIRLDTDEVIG